MILTAKNMDEARANLRFKLRTEQTLFELTRELLEYSIALETLLQEHHTALQDANARLIAGGL